MDWHEKGPMPTATSEIGGNAYAFVILGRSKSEAKCGYPGIHAVTLKSLGGAEYCRSHQACAH